MSRHEKMAIDSIKPHARNARIGNVEVIMESIRSNGMYRPIVVNERTGEILAGNHTWKAMKELGETEIDAWIGDYTDEEAERILLVDNRANDLATYNKPVLAELLGEYEGNFEGTGYDDASYNALLDELGQGFGSNEKDPVPIPPEDPITKPGDLYIMGEHRLVCGDSRDLDVSRVAVNGELAQMLLADPPYNVGYEGGSGNEEKRDDSYADRFTDQAYYSFLYHALANGHACTDEKAALHLWCASTEFRAVLRAVTDAGWQDRMLIVWNKLNPHFAAFRAQYMPRKEPMFYCFKQECSPRWHGPTNEVDVWDAEQPKVNDHHPTMKPVDLYERSLANHTERGDLVLELYGGSGTTLIAAENIGRRASLVELSPAFCDVIVKRWENATGKEAQRVESALSQEDGGQEEDEGTGEPEGPSTAPQREGAAS